MDFFVILPSLCGMIGILFQTKGKETSAVMRDRFSGRASAKPKKKEYMLLKIQKQRALIMLSVTAAVLLFGGFFVGRMSTKGLIRDYAAQLADTKASLQAVSDELRSAQEQQQQSVPAESRRQHVSKCGAACSHRACRSRSAHDRNP